MTPAAPADALGRILDAYNGAPAGFHTAHWARFQPDPQQLDTWRDRFADLPTELLDVAALQLISDLQAEYASRNQVEIEDPPEFLARAAALAEAMQARGYTPSAAYCEGWMQAATLGAPALEEVIEADAAGRPAIAAWLEAFSDDTLRGFIDYVVRRWRQWRGDLQIFDVVAPTPYEPILAAIHVERSRRHTSASAAEGKTGAGVASLDFPAGPPAAAPADPQRRAPQPPPPPSSSRGLRK